MAAVLYRFARRKLNQKPKEKIFVDDMPEVTQYFERVNRTDPMGERFTDSSTGPARPGVYIDADRDGEFKMRVEIGQR